jgi:hypothetical protein
MILSPEDADMREVQRGQRKVKRSFAPARRSEQPVRSIFPSFAAKL